MNMSEIKFKTSIRQKLAILGVIIGNKIKMDVADKMRYRNTGYCVLKVKFTI